MGDAQQPAKPELEEARAGEVALVDRAGNRVFVPKEDVGAAMSDAVRGFREESPEEAATRRKEAKYGDQEAKAFLEGGARGLTFGASDLLLTKTGLVDAEALEGRKEVNPVAAGLGEATGIGAGLAVGPGALLAKGAGMAGRAAAAAVGEGLGARLVGAGVQGMVEGSAYGLGNTLSESALGNTELNAQKLVAGAGLGALVGFGGGAAGELLNTGLRLGAGKLAQHIESLPDAIQDVADQKTLKAAGAIQKDFRKLSEDDVSKVAGHLRDAGIVTPGASKADVLERVQGALEKSGQDIGDYLKAADDVSPVSLHPDWETRPLKPGESKYVGGFDMGAVLKRAREDVLAPLQADPATKAEASSLASLLDDYEARAKDGVSFEEANRFKGTLQKQVKDFLNTADTKVAKKKLSGIFNDEIERQLGDTLDESYMQGFQEAKARYGSFKTATKLAQQGVDREAGNQAFGLTDKILAAGGIAHGGPAGALLGGGAALVNKLARERGDSFLATGLDKLANSPWFQTAADAFSQYAKKQLQAGSNVFAEYTPLLANALARGPEDALLTHMVLSRRDAQYRDVMASTGMDYHEDGNAVAHKALALSGLRQQLAQHDEAAESAVRGALGGGGLRGDAQLRSALLGDSAAGPLKGFQARLDSLQALAQNPQALQQRISAALGPLSAVAPDMAAAVALTAKRAVDFLSSVAPKPDEPLGDIPALRKPWAPSDAERAKFERYAQAVQNPHSVFDGLASGDVSQESAEALQAVYPQLYGEWKLKAMTALAQHKGELDAKQRLALSALLQQPMDSSLQPQRLAQLQAIFQVPGNGAASANAQRAKPMKPRDESTQAQHLESLA